MSAADEVAAQLSRPATLRTDHASRGVVRAALVTARPRQWIKNGLVIAAPAAAKALGRDGVPVRVALAFVAFCAISSGIYAINDAHDAVEDRRHPTKCRRPVAAGELSQRAAVVLGVVLIAVGMVICLMIRPLLALVATGYVALTVSYTLIWRDVPLLDILAIAGGFLLRAVAGGAAAPVDLSEWFLLVISFAAVLVASGKRFAELRRTAAAASSAVVARRRRVLETYTEWRLSVMVGASALGALFTYCTWAVVVPSTGFPWRELTIAPFAVCIVRYVVLVRAGKSEAPEELIVADRPLLAGASSWIVLFALVLNGSS